mgnify:CR=1 FL=1
MLDGRHSLFNAFAPSAVPDHRPLLDGRGERWLMTDLAFKPYACGTMVQPFIDCAIALARDGVKADDISEIVCDVAEGTVHRLWEPLAAKQRPPNAYAGKFSQPYCIAAGFVLGNAGLDAFTDERVADPPAKRAPAVQAAPAATKLAR